MKILVLGGASYDDIIQVDQFFNPISQNVFARKAYSVVGSTGAGKALALAKLGYDVTFVAVIGNDEYGKKIEQKMKDSKVRFYPNYFGNTERHCNIMNPSGDRISIFLTKEDGSEINVKQFASIVQDADLVVLNIKDYCQKFIPMIQQYQKPIYCDIHDYDLGNPYHQVFLNAADYLFLSSDRLPQYKEFMNDMIKEGKNWVVCTHAKNGSSAINQTDSIVSISADPIDILDTNGAGDNFFAGFLFGYLEGFSLEQSLLCGKFSANSCITSKEIVGENLNREYLLKKLSECDKK